MFAFAIWDESWKGLFLARDHFGIKPLYFHDDGKTFRCASQVKATLGQAVACIMEVSLQPLYKGQPTFKKLCLLIDSVGFEYAGNVLQIYDEEGRVIYVDTLFRKQMEL